MIGDKIKLLREELNISQEELSKRINVSPSTIAMYETNKRQPNYETILKLANIFNCTTDYLIGKSDIRNQRNDKEEIIKGIMAANGLKFKDIEDIKFDIDSNVFPITDIPVKVPVLGKISAGLPILATENIESYEYAPSSYIKKGFDYFYLKVDGDSMNLKFNNGDIVLVQKQDTLENDEIGVIMVNDEATVKKFKFENNMVILYPMSTNPEHTVQIYKSEQIKIIGKVISYQGKI